MKEKNIFKIFLGVMCLFMSITFVHADQSFLLTKNIPLWNDYPSLAVNPDNGDIMVVWTQFDLMDPSYGQIWAVKLQRKSSGKYKMRKAINVSPDKEFYADQRVFWVPNDNSSEANIRNIKDGKASGEFFSVFDTLDSYLGTKTCDIWGEILNPKTGKPKNPKNIISDGDCNYVPNFLVASNNGNQDRILFYTKTEVSGAAMEQKTPTHDTVSVKLDQKYNKVKNSEKALSKNNQATFIETVSECEDLYMSIEKKPDGYVVRVFDKNMKEINKYEWKGFFIRNIFVKNVKGMNCIFVGTKEQGLSAVRIYRLYPAGKILWINTHFFDENIMYTAGLVPRKNNSHNLNFEFDIEPELISNKKTAIGYLVKAEKSGWAVLEKVSDKFKPVGKKENLFKHDGQLTYMDAQLIELNSSDSDMDSAPRKLRMQ